MAEALRAIARTTWHVLVAAGVVHLVLGGHWALIAWGVFFGAMLGAGWVWYDDYKRHESE